MWHIDMKHKERFDGETITFLPLWEFKKYILYLHIPHNAFCFWGVGIVIQIKQIVIQIKQIWITKTTPQKQKALW